MTSRLMNVTINLRRSSRVDAVERPAAACAAVSKAWGFRTRFRACPFIVVSAVALLLGRDASGLEDTDACVVARTGFETMCEINPQIGKQLKVIASSPEVVPAVFCFRADYSPPFKEDLLAGLRDER